MSVRPRMAYIRINEIHSRLNVLLLASNSANLDAGSNGPRMARQRKSDRLSGNQREDREDFENKTSVTLFVHVIVGTHF